MKSKKSKIFMATLVAILLGTGCSQRRVASRPAVHTPSRTSWLSTETRSIHNNSMFVLVPQEDGLPVEEGSKKTGYSQYELKPGDSVPLRYFQWYGRRTVALTVKAYCPEVGQIDVGRSTSRRQTITCTPGEYMGLARSRTVSVRSSRSRQTYNARDITFNNRDVLGPNGRPYY